MKKNTWTKIFAWIFIIVPIYFLWQYIFIYQETLTTYQINDKIIVELENHTWSFIIDIMQTTNPITDNAVLVDINSNYTWNTIPKNNSQNSLDGTYQAKNNCLFLLDWNRLNCWTWLNMKDDFLWSRDWKYYIRFDQVDPKWPKNKKVYMYDMSSKKYKYLDLVDINGKSLTVQKIIGILP